METCRICLDNNNLSPLFENQADSTEDSKILFAITGCKIEANDGLPQWICHACSVLLNGAIKLRELSLYTEKILLVNSTRISSKTEMKTNKTDENIQYNNNGELTELKDEALKNCDTIQKFSGKKLQNEMSKIEYKCDNDNPTKGRRQRMPLEKLQKYLSLALTPNDRKGPVACLLCHRELKTLRYFINHAKTHFAAEHTCQACGKKFVSPHSMRYHMMRLHGLEKRHMCQHCDFRGVDLDQLRNHVRRVHTQERPHACATCGAAFALAAGLRQHQRSHAKAKTEQCERCSAMFRSRSELAGHRRRVHSRAIRPARPSTTVQ